MILHSGQHFDKDPTRQFLTRMGIVCNFEPMPGMEAGMFRDGDGELEIFFSDGGDGGGSKVMPLLRFLSKNFPDLYKLAMTTE